MMLEMLKIRAISESSKVMNDLLLFGFSEPRLAADPCMIFSGPEHQRNRVWVQVIPEHLLHKHWS